VPPVTVGKSRVNEDEAELAVPVPLELTDAINNEHTDNHK
jgi:hypothetical protein